MSSEGYDTRNAKTIPPELSIEGTVNLLGGLPQDWGSCAEQGMTGRICQRLGNEDGVGFAPSENRD
jgi:hypothetical protein